MPSKTVGESFLSASQQDALNSPLEGTLFILGNEGTGKTTALLARAVRLSAEGRVCLMAPTRVAKQYLENALTTKNVNCEQERMETITVLTPLELVRAGGLFGLSPSPLLDDALRVIAADLAATQGLSFAGSDSKILDELPRALEGDYAGLCEVFSCDREQAILYLERLKKYLQGRSLFPVSLFESVLIWSFAEGARCVWDHLLIDSADDFSAGMLAVFSRMATVSLTLTARSMPRDVTFPSPLHTVCLDQTFVGKIAEVTTSSNGAETLSSLGGFLSTVGACAAAFAKTGAGIGSVAGSVGVAGAVLGAIPFLGPLALMGGVLAARKTVANLRGAASDTDKPLPDKPSLIIVGKSPRLLSVAVLFMSYASIRQYEEDIEQRVQAIFGLEPGAVVNVDVMPIRSAKGVSFDFAVVVLNEAPPDGHEARSLLEIASTRARSIKIICDGEEGQKWLPILASAGLEPHHV